MNIGDKFKVMEEGRIYEAMLIYNRCDEEYPYMVVNTDNWEVIDCYPDVKNIKVFNPLKKLIEILGQNENDVKRFGYIHGSGYFALIDKTEHPMSLGYKIFECKLTTEERDNAIVVCSIYNIKKG